MTFLRRNMARTGDEPQRSWRPMAGVVAIVLLSSSLTVSCTRASADAGGPTSPATSSTGRKAPTTRTSESGTHRVPSTTSPSTTSPSTLGPVASRATPTGKPLAGLVVGVDPGHNGDNYANPQIIDQQVWNGRSYENCNTTGTETDSGYTEAQFNWNVAQYLKADLEADGAQVVLTRDSNTGVGPCVTTRARILNTTDLAIAIHADGGPPDGRGFAVLEPVADGPNDQVVASSAAFGSVVRTTFNSMTGMPVSTYDGTDGIKPRDDLAGTNLTTVPYVLIECGNMRNATDASLLVTSTFQQSAATALAAAMVTYVQQSHLKGGA